MQKGAAVQAQAVAVSIGAGGSGGAMNVGGGDGADRRSVDDTRCEQARAKQERQGSATVGSGSVWCRRWLRQLRATARVTQEKTGEGRRWFDRKANPSPLFL